MSTSQLSAGSLRQEISQAHTAVQSLEDRRSELEQSLADARRELNLLVELAHLRGVDVELPPAALRDAAGQDETHSVRANGASRDTREELVATIVALLTEHGEPMHIRDLVTGVRARGAAIPGRGEPANLISFMSRQDAIVRPKRGFYGLKEWGLRDSTPTRRRRKTQRKS